MSVAVRSTGATSRSSSISRRALSVVVGLGENPYLRRVGREEVEPALVLLNTSRVLDVPGANSKYVHRRSLIIKGD